MQRLQRPCEHTEPLPHPLYSYAAMDYTSVSKEVTSPHFQSEDLGDAKNTACSKGSRQPAAPFLQVEGGPGQVTRAGLCPAQA